ncbi:MAG: hypothetical protein HQM09_14700 [Candidatus Riflebacteria bacterium]|nr:hypothetical protein [Candidatus Riflebacteria bacterium]
MKKLRVKKESQKVEKKQVVQENSGVDKSVNVLEALCNLDIDLEEMLSGFEARFPEMKKHRVNINSKRNG